MNNNSSNRLDRIERLLEGHGNAIARHDEAMARHDEAMARHDEAMARHDEAIARHDEAIANLEAILAQLSQRTDNIAIAVDRLANTQLQLAQIFDEERATTRATLGSINAALERIDRVMDYLLRQQNGNG